jgi:hypothetical protein
MVAGGNRLFHRAVVAIGLNEHLSKRLLGEVFAAIGSSPSEASADELGLLLPEIERRLRLLVPHETAAPALARLRRMLLCWEE